jgi:hypothetical protein
MTPGENAFVFVGQDIERVAAAAAELPPATGVYTEDDFVMNLFETVLDYMLQTSVVVKSLEYYRTNRWDEIRTVHDLKRVLATYPDDQEGNTRLAVYLWGYRYWTRAHQLRDLVNYFESVGATDQPSLHAWANQSDFKRDFEGRVRGLGPAVYQWLVMRQGVDTIKPDVHVHRFTEAAVGRPLSDADTIAVVTGAARVLGVKAFETRLAYLGGGPRGSVALPGALIAWARCTHHGLRSGASEGESEPLARRCMSPVETAAHRGNRGMPACISASQGSLECWTKEREGPRKPLPGRA